MFKYKTCKILINQLEQSSDNLAVCNKQLSNYAVSEERYKTKINELEEEINEKQGEVNKYKSEYDELTRNLANKICCKMKIDNNKINYYKVEDNNIICSEDIGDEISCSFGWLFLYFLIRNINLLKKKQKKKKGN